MIRIMTFVVIVSGLGVGSSARADEAEDKAVAFAEKLGGKVTRDHSVAGKPVVTVSLSGSGVTDGELKQLLAINGLTVLNLSNTRVTDAGMNELAAFKNLTTLILDQKQITNATLKALGENKLLHLLSQATTADGKRPSTEDDVASLSLFQTQVTGEGMKGLTRLKNFQTLTMRDQQVTDAMLKALREHNMLHLLSQATAAGGKRPTKAEDVTTLDLYETQVTDAGLKELASLTNLSTLSLPNNKLTNAGLKELAPLTNLSTLSLPNNKLTNAGLKELASLANLTTIDVTVTNGSLKALREANLLHLLRQAKTGDGKRANKADDVAHLNLSGTEVTDVGLKELVPLLKLTTLNLDRTHVTDAGLKELAPLTKLTNLGLNSFKVSDVGLKHLAPFTSLTTIRLHERHMTDRGLKEVASLKKLTTLNVYIINGKAADAGLKALRECGLLHVLSCATTADGRRPDKPEDVATLDLTWVRLTEAGIKELAPLKNLTSLTLDRDHITDAVLKALREADLLHVLSYAYADYRRGVSTRPAKVEEVTFMNLSGTRLTDAGVKELFPLKNITTLFLPSKGVTDAGVGELQKALPKCKISR